MIDLERDYDPLAPAVEADPGPTLQWLVDRCPVHHHVLPQRTAPPPRFRRGHPLLRRRRPARAELRIGRRTLLDRLPGLRLDHDRPGVRGNAAFFVRAWRHLLSAGTSLDPAGRGP